MPAPAARRSLCARSNARTALGLALAAAACEPDLVVGSWHCPAPSRTAEADGGALTPVTDPVTTPWSTGFETGLCDWDRAQGFCYAAANGTFEVVSSPTRSGSKALAFNVTADGTGMSQARCVREGTLPPYATYGAWFYVPTTRTNSGNWNLMHFQGGQPGSPLLPWWDVSLANSSNGGLLLQVVNYVGMSMKPVTYQQAPGALPVPIGSWFHIEFRWRRATDATGEIALFQDGRQVVQKSGIPTDDADWGQWYVGNLADALDPPESTVYVDDVSIRPYP